MNDPNNTSAPVLTLIDIYQNAALKKDAYANFPLAFINDHVVRMSVMTEAYYWHYHPDSDETFLGVEGILLIELEDRTIELHAGQLFTIPKNTKHRTLPKGERSVNMTFESQNMQTVVSDN